jgi:hypothetical protein
VHTLAFEAPSAALKVPQAQSWQKFSPLRAWYLLGAHLSQALAPSDEALPAAHAVHCEMVLPPPYSLKRPAR